MLYTDWKMVTGWRSGVTQTGSWLQGGLAVLHTDWQLVTR